MYFFHFSYRDQAIALEAKILQLQVDLSHSTAKVVILEEIITQKKASNKNLMDRIQVLKKAEQKREKKEIQIQSSFPADEDPLQAKKVDLMHNHFQINLNIYM